MKEGVIDARFDILQKQANELDHYIELKDSGYGLYEASVWELMVPRIQTPPHEWWIFFDDEEDKYRHDFNRLWSGKEHYRRLRYDEILQKLDWYINHRLRPEMQKRMGVDTSIEAPNNLITFPKKQD